MRELRPSSADTWMRCWGQPALVESLRIVDRTSEYAAEGTAAHTLAESCLREGLDARDRIGDVITVVDDVPGAQAFEFTVDDAMAGHVNTYLEVVRREAYGGTLLVEQKVDVSGIVLQERTGTSDAIVVPGDEGQPLQIHDLKYGKGVEVFARNNRQLRIYGAGFLDSMGGLLGDWDEVEFYIHQPRIKREPDVWRTSTARLEKFAERVRKAARKALDAKPGEGLRPGSEQCHWCPAKARCPKLETAVTDRFEDIDAATGELIPPEDLADLGRARALAPLAILWANAVMEECYRQMVAEGREVPGWKIVEGPRGARAWRDEKEAEERCARFRIKKDELYTHKLRSPTQLQKILTERQYEKLQNEGFIVQASGNPTVVSEEDPRSPLDVTTKFENLEGTDNG